jgi:hypothetical protein
VSRRAVVVRVAPLSIRPDRLTELRRIFGADVEVSETWLSDPSGVEQIAASVDADAVVIDLATPPELADLVDALGSRVLLRPVMDYVPTSRGERQPVFVGYARLTQAGELEPLADSELALD